MYIRAGMVSTCILVDRYAIAVVADVSGVLFKVRRGILQYSIFLVQKLVGCLRSMCILVDKFRWTCGFADNYCDAYGADMVSMCIRVDSRIDARFCNTAYFVR